MEITVAICTRNRAPSLGKALESIAAAIKPDCEWEIVIIDNGSSDDTQAIVEAFAAKLPVRYVREPKAGLSNARNKAVSCARGDYIIWTDDDVLVDRNWLVAYVHGFAKWPAASIFGGRIVPVLQQPCVQWFHDVVPLLGTALAARDLGNEPAPLTAEGNRIPFGANFAVRMKEQREYVYDPTLGAGTPHGGEETTVLLAMLAAGHAGRWLPDCKVSHVIGHDRQTANYIACYFETLARTAALQNGELPGRSIGGVPPWLWKRLLRRRVDYEIKRRLARPPVWVRCLIDLALVRGRIMHLRSQHRC